MRIPFVRLMTLGTVLALAASLGVVGLLVTRAQVSASVYRERLRTLAAEYESLRREHNEAVRRTAVTELVVRGNSLSVRIRDAWGVVAEIPTPYDPSREIFVDYAVIGGRLWIRRVFDDRTAPWDGLVIDPGLGHIDWTDPSAAVGKAVYRSLTEGRWIVTVTGDGSLGLAPATGDEPADLRSAPPVRDFEEIARAADRDAGSITVAEVFRKLIEGD